MRPTALLLALCCALPARAWAQTDAAACVDQVARLTEHFPVNAEGEQAKPLAGAAGSRRGAWLDEQQRRAIGSRIEAARAAGERGDADACLNDLAQVRAALRQSGVGGIQPGTAGDLQVTGGQGGAGSGSGAAGSAQGGGGTSSGAAGISPDPLTGPNRPGTAAGAGSLTGGARPGGADGAGGLGGTGGAGGASGGAGGGGSSGGGSSGG